MATNSATKAGNWNDTTVWSDGVVPVAGYTSSLAGYAIVVNVDITAGPTLVITDGGNNASCLTVAANRTINATIQSTASANGSGVIRVASGTLTFPSTAALSSTSGASAAGHKLVVIAAGAGLSDAATWVMNGQGHACNNSGTLTTNGVWTINGADTTGIYSLSGVSTIAGTWTVGSNAGSTAIFTGGRTDVAGTWSISGGKGVMCYSGFCTVAGTWTRTGGTIIYNYSAGVVITGPSMNAVLGSLSNSFVWLHVGTPSPAAATPGTNYLIPVVADVVNGSAYLSPLSLSGTYPTTATTQAADATTLTGTTLNAAGADTTVAFGASNGTAKSGAVYTAGSAAQLATDQAAVGAAAAHIDGGTTIIGVTIPDLYFSFATDNYQVKV